MITRAMLVKLSAESVKAIGADNASEFDAKLTAFIAESTQAKTFMAESQVTLEALQKTITALEGKILTEDKVKEICGASATESIAAWAASEAGEKIIGARASKITMEALAGIGTTPAKPAPISADAGDAATAVKNLEAAGKFDEAWAADKNIQAEFPSAKSYSAFRRAQINGQIRIATKN